MIEMEVEKDKDIMIEEENKKDIDVKVKEKIMEVMRDIKEKIGMGMIIIKNDIGVIEGNEERVEVVYEGEVVEKEGI